MQLRQLTIVKPSTKAKSATKIRFPVLIETDTLAFSGHCATRSAINPVSTLLLQCPPDIRSAALFPGSVFSTSEFALVARRNVNFGVAVSRGYVNGIKVHSLTCEGMPHWFNPAESKCTAQEWNDWCAWVTHWKSILEDDIKAMLDGADVMSLLNTHGHNLLLPRSIAKLESDLVKHKAELMNSSAVMSTKLSAAPLGSVVFA